MLCRAKKEEDDLSPRVSSPSQKASSVAASEKAERVSTPEATPAQVVSLELTSPKSTSSNTPTLKLTSRKQISQKAVSPTPVSSSLSTGTVSTTKVVSPKEEIKASMSPPPKVTSPTMISPKLKASDINSRTRVSERVIEIESRKRPAQPNDSHNISATEYFTKGMYY